MEEITNKGMMGQVHQNISEKNSLHPVNKSTLQRLKIIEGQVKGIQKMVEEGKYCIDILTQISSVQAALDRAGKMVLRRHIDNCITNAIKNNGEKSIELIDELMEVFSREEI